MIEQPDFFRDFGIIPYGVSPPPQKVRAYFPRGHVIGQYIGTCLMSGLGLGLALVVALTLPITMNVLAAVAIIVGFGFVVYLATRNDYSWIELDGETIRAKHLYTGRVIERPIEEIQDLLTLVLRVRTPTTVIVEAWLGRVRGIMIRFRDRRTPLQVARTDPPMKNARELIEAIIFRMSEKGKIEAEIVDFAGKPLIRRIYWKAAR